MLYIVIPLLCDFMPNNLYILYTAQKLRWKIGVIELPPTFGIYTCTKYHVTKVMPIKSLHMPQASHPLRPSPQAEPDERGSPLSVEPSEPPSPARTDRKGNPILPREAGRCPRDPGECRAPEKSGVFLVSRSTERCFL